MGAPRARAPLARLLAVVAVRAMPRGAVRMGLAARLLPAAAVVLAGVRFRGAVNQLAPPFVASVGVVTPSSSSDV